MALLITTSSSQLTCPKCHFGGLIKGAVCITKSSFSSVCTRFNVLALVSLNCSRRLDFCFETTAISTTFCHVYIIFLLRIITTTFSAFMFDASDKSMILTSTNHTFFLIFTHLYYGSQLVISYNLSTIALSSSSLSAFSACTFKFVRKFFAKELRDISPNV